MTTGNADISREAIRTGLARQALEHRGSSGDSIRFERDPVVDDCYFRIKVMVNDETNALEKVILETTQLSGRGAENKDDQEAPVEIELCAASHTIDLTNKRATTIGSETESFALTTEQVDIIRSGVLRATEDAMNR